LSEELSVVKEDESVDDLILGGLRIIQPKKGYRFSLDSILLAHFVEIKDSMTIVDLGTGNGVIPIILSLFSKDSRIIGIELQEKMVDRAKRSLIINRLESRVKIFQADIKELSKVLLPNSADVVVSNPPFWKIGEGLIAVDPEQAMARHELTVQMEDIVYAASRVLKSKGRLYLIQNAERIAETFELFKKNRFIATKLRMVHPYLHRDAKQVLIEARKDYGKRCAILPPLIVYRENGEYSAEILKMYGLKG
jgi:tRNA1Val (adenine37-N6)-methyltransferase